METYRLIFPEHLNHNGYLFGGNLLKWVDEYVYIAANIDFPGNHFVTIALDNVVFKKSVPKGSILKFIIKNIKVGRTSLCYNVQVYTDDMTSGKEALVFETNVTFVNIDEGGKKDRIHISEV